MVGIESGTAYSTDDPEGDVVDVETAWTVTMLSRRCRLLHYQKLLWLSSYLIGEISVAGYDDVVECYYCCRWRKDGFEIVKTL